MKRCLILMLLLGLLLTGCRKQAGAATRCGDSRQSNGNRIRCANTGTDADAWHDRF